MIGILSGFIAFVPLRQWRTSIQDGLRHAAMGMSAVFALLWVLSRRTEDGIESILFFTLGAAAVAGGVWIRRTYWVCTERTGRNRHSNISVSLIAYGLAAMTTSPLVLSAVGFVCMAFWLDTIGRNGDYEEESSGRSVMRESALIGGLALAILILIDARGVLPFQ